MNRNKENYLLTTNGIFRARSLPGRWHFGYLTSRKSGYMKDSDKSILRITDITKDEDNIIDPDTIGVCTFKKDSHGKLIYSGDVLRNRLGQIFEVRFGSHAMYCPVDDMMLETIGFFTVADGIYEDMPLGPTEDYATIIGNIYDNPEYKVDEKFRCMGEVNLSTVGGWYLEE